MRITSERRVVLKREGLKVLWADIQPLLNRLTKDEPTFWLMAKSTCPRLCGLDVTLRVVCIKIDNRALNSALTNEDSSQLPLKIFMKRPRRGEHDLQAHIWPPRGRRSTLSSHEWTSKLPTSRYHLTMKHRHEAFSSRRHLRSPRISKM